MIRYKIYPQVIVLFNFTHITLMYAIYMLTVEPLLYIVKILSPPKKFGGDASPFISTLHFGLASLYSNQKVLPKIYLWAESEKILHKLFTLSAESVSKMVGQCD